MVPLPTFKQRYFWYQLLQDLKNLHFSDCGPTAPLYYFKLEIGSILSFNLYIPYPFYIFEFLQNN